MKLLYLLLLIAYVTCITKKDGKKVFYRQDYKLLEEFDAFYKYHSVILNFSDAQAKCSAEGGSMFRPLSLAESNAVLNTLVPKEVPRIWIGVHDLYSEGDFVTLEGLPLELTYYNWAPGEPNDNFNHEDCVVLFRDASFNDGTCFTKEAYVCKREVSTITQNVLCETYDLGYEYSIELDKCYKVHTDPAKWTEAYRICKGEEASLTIINSKEEADYLVNQMARYPGYKYPGNFDKEFFLLGFNDLIHHGVFVTTDGKSLAQAGYDKWGLGQPDQTNDNEHCGSMFRDGTLNDLSCDNRAMFFCEKELTMGGPPTYIGQPSSNPQPSSSQQSYNTPVNQPVTAAPSNPDESNKDDKILRQASESREPPERTSNEKSSSEYNKPGALVELPDA